MGTNIGNIKTCTGTSEWEQNTSDIKTIEWEQTSVPLKHVQVNAWEQNTGDIKQVNGNKHR